MRNLTQRLLGWLSFGVVTFLLSSCLHIVEEVIVRKDGSGSYKMTMDMSEVKSMMDAFKTMGEEESEGQDEQTSEEEASKTDSNEEASDAESESTMAQLGTEISSVSQSLRSIAGLTNVKEINDTSAYMFGYSFDFANIEALNKAIRVIQREKYETKVEETFRFKGGTFERLNVADMGEQFKKTLTETEEADEEGSMGMVKAFFSGMTYKQVYRFPDAKVKKSSNPLSELSGDGQSISILIKPLDEEQQKKKPSVATIIKLK